MKTRILFVAGALAVAFFACRSPDEPKTPPNSPVPRIERHDDSSDAGGSGTSTTPDALKEPKK